MSETFVTNFLESLFQAQKATTDLLIITPPRSIPVIHADRVTSIQMVYRTKVHNGQGTRNHAVAFVKQWVEHDTS
jgi:hypothetical protein